MESIRVRRGAGGGCLVRWAPVKCLRQARLRARLKAKNTRGVFKVCCTSFELRRRPRAPTLNF
eukprot:6908386-Pyramimonas_sp.AAC.1